MNAMPATGRGGRSAVRRDGDVRVRMYAVGFGDAFLVLIPCDDRPRRVLIDCGSIARKALAMDEIVASIVEDCRDADGIARIDVVVATHRHRDHVSGFASPRWNEVEVGEVWMPWTEHPGHDDARQLRAHQLQLAGDLANLVDLHDPDLEGPDAADADTLGRFAVMALNAAPNQKAMRALHEGFAGNPRRRFLPEGDAYPEPLRSDALPGVKAFVLGPSRDAATIRALDPPRGESYLRLAHGSNGDADSPEVFGPEWAVDDSEYFATWPHLALDDTDRERIRGFSQDSEGALAVALDKALNGTSLVLVLVVGDAHLLFPGDAQWGTWERMLANEDACALLRRTTLLKVGHHGSHNATPRSFVDDHLPAQVQAMCSTRAIAQWPEIPRGPMLDALAAKGSRIARSDRESQARDDAFAVDADHRYIEAVIPLHGDAMHSDTGLVAAPVERTRRAADAIAKKPARPRAATGDATSKRPPATGKATTKPSKPRAKAPAKAVAKRGRAGNGAAPRRERTR